MSGSEPRLSAGDGLSEVRAGAFVQPAASPSAVLGALDRSSTGQASAASATVSPSQTEKERELLPPLVSLSDLVLEAPPWLFSAAVHMIVIIVLGLLFIAPERAEEFLLQFSYQESFEEDLSGSEFEVPLDLAAQQFDTALSPQMLPEMEDALAAPPVVVESPLQSETVPSDTAPIRMALSGREKGMQKALLSAYGGTGATQQAVMEALRWLARNQGKDGLWSMRGRYSDGIESENQEAATAMALLAFQGAGYTPAGNPKEPFTKIVARAWKQLLKKEDENGNFFHTGRGHAQLYTQALCTIAICELYGMTRDETYREPAQRAIDYCVKVQSREGGWRYFPGSGSDLSVTGWFVMALQSARMAGLEVPSPTLENISRFLETVSRESGSQYAYQARESATRGMTAEGLLCRQYLGWERSDGRLQRGANYLIEHLPSWENHERNVYYWYYATQVCHHMEGLHWRTWNNVMREVIPRHQIKEGRERGSWDPDGDRWGNAGGRLFVTCLSVYMLEVYYRHLPIYQLDLLGGKL